MSRITEFFSSILGRLLLLIGGISALFLAAMVISLSAFQTTSTQLQDLSENRVADLVAGQTLSQEVGQIQASLPAMLTGADREAVQTAHRTLAERLFAVHELTEALPVGIANQIATLLYGTETALDTLAVARMAEFTAQADTARRLAEARDLAQRASAALETATDDTYFDVVTGGEQTIADVAQMLDRLVYDDFAMLQGALEARTQFELMLGAALGAVRADDPGLKRLLQDVADAADIRLQRLIPALEASPLSRPAAEALAETVPTLLNVFARGGSIPAGRILTLRNKVEIPLVTAIDDLTFELTMQSEAATQHSNRALDRLLHQNVASIRDRAQLDHATQEVMISAFDLALVSDRVTLGMLQGSLQDKVRKLDRLLEGADADLREALSPVLALADADTGIARSREAALAARQEVTTAATTATEAVIAISKAMDNMMSDAVTAIDRTATNLNDQMAAADTRLMGISAGSIALLFVAPLLAWSWIARPLGHITATTDRLAQGDLSELSGLPNKGEMGRLAKALTTFRATALEQIETQRAKDAAEAAARTRAEEVAEQRREAERAAHAAEMERTATEQRQKEAEAARTQAARDAADAERRARTQEQADVVAALAAGLQDLAAGNLGARIEQTFPPAYDGLRKDFNGALANLSTLVEDLQSSAQRIDGNTREIANGARDLSQRTEANASTLEETAAAIAELTQAATGQASGAAEADRTARSAHEGAQNGRDVVTKAVETMDGIRSSSDQIETITSMIEDIAFQTNLLALNAGVEAARAGDAGRGFAVVASEVRALSQRSAKAAKDISGLIRESNAKIVEGVSRVGRAHSALDHIIEDVHSVTARIGTISTSAEEQKTTITGLNGAIQQLDRDAQANAAMFEETQAATEGLAQEANRLAQLVSRFKLSAETADGSDVLLKSA